jgi:hypothetical protein
MTDEHDRVHRFDVTLIAGGGVRALAAPGRALQVDPNQTPIKPRVESAYGSAHEDTNIMKRFQSFFQNLN